MEVKKSKGLAIGSIIFLVIDIVLLIFLIRITNTFSLLYKGLNVTVPSITKVALSSRYILIIIALILIAKEFLKNKLTTLIINIAVFLISGFIIGFLVYGFFLPLYQMSTTGK